MPPVTRMIAQAAQTYGLIVNDQTGATVAFRAEDPTPLMRQGQAEPVQDTYFKTSLRRLRGSQLPSGLVPVGRSRARRTALD